MKARASIGIAVATHGIYDAAELLHHADLAMYGAKASSEHHVQVYEAELVSGKAVAARGR